MAAFTNRNSKGKVILIIAGILLLLIVAVVFIFGVQSIFKIILVVIEGILLLGLLFLLAYLFYYLFIKKQKFDVNYVNKQKLVQACTITKRPLLKDLYLSGDKGHTRAKVGAITGYARIQVLTRKYLYTEQVDAASGMKIKRQITIPNERGEPIPQYEIEKIEQDVFTVKEKGLFSMFQEPMVIRLDPTDHNELVGDVTIFGFSLIPICEYWFLNSDHLDVRKIDYAILKEAERTAAFVILSDMKELIDISTGIDSKHKKGIEQKSLIELPETQAVNKTPNPYG